MRAQEPNQADATRWDLNQAAGLTQAQLHHLFHSIAQWAPHPRPASDNQAFNEPAIPVSVLLIINADANSLAAAEEQLIEDTPVAVDAFNYGTQHENLVHSHRYFDSK